MQWLVSLLASTNFPTFYFFTVSGRQICALYARQIARQCDIVLERFVVAVLTSSWGKTRYWFRFRRSYSSLFTILQLLFILLVSVIERMCDSKSECVCVCFLVCMCVHDIPWGKRNLLLSCVWLRGTGGKVRRMVQKQFREVNNKSIYTYMVSVTAAPPLSPLKMYRTPCDWGYK